jgi:hypothetical protein
MKKIIRLTESDLIRLVKRVIKENQTPSVMGQIFAEMRADTGCSDTIARLRNVISMLISGTDYSTYSKTGTWGEYLNSLNKLNVTLEQEMARVTKTTNPMFTKIQALCVAQGINPGDKCVIKFQKLILSKAKGQNELETESGKIEWADGIVGLATLQSLVLGMIDFFQSVLAKNPELTDSPLVTQTAKNQVTYKGIKGVEQKVGTMQR